MAPTPLSSPLQHIRNAWAFFRDQSVLSRVWLWLLFLPLCANNILAQERWGVECTTWNGAWGAITLVLLLVFSILSIWGSASVLTVGKRLLQNKAGRKRTSFNAVSKQARPFIIPLLLTSLLRACMTLLWTILLIVPGIIYSIRTAFYMIIVVCEGESYRPALLRSIETVRGRTWQIFVQIIIIGIVLFAPGWAFDIIFNNAFTAAVPMPIAILTVIISAILWSGAWLLYMLSTISLYSQLRVASGNDIEEAL